MDELERLLVSSAPTIQRHAAVIALGSDWVCSGVFVKSFGYEGILTAGHCASTFLAEDRFALSISEERHQFFIEKEAVEHVPIGYDETQGYTTDGPDLSFVKLRDEKIRHTIRSQGIAFFDLDFHRLKLKDVFLGGNIATFNWSVAGNPNEKIQVTTQLVNNVERNFVMNTAALIQGNLWGYDLRGDFDYVKVLVGSAFEEFPNSYAGVSGGGIWYQRFVTDDGKNYRVEPILAGIACWQSRSTLKKGYMVREITGHGWVSVYGHVRRALAEKGATE
jgi:hypothetical protein